MFCLNFHILKIVSEYMFLKKRCLQLVIKSYHLLCLPLASTSSKRPQIQQFVSDETIGFRFLKMSFLISLNSRNLGFIIFENQSLRVSVANLNSTEKNSAREVFFSRLTPHLQHLLTDQKYFY